MNLLPYREQQKQYRSQRKRSSVDGAVCTHTGARCVSLKQAVHKQSWQSVIKRRWKRWNKQLHHRLVPVTPSIDGARISSSQTEALSQQLVRVRRLLLQGFWRPVSVTSAFLIGVFSTGAVYHSLQASWAAESTPVAQVAGAATTASDALSQPVVDEQVLTDEDIANLTDLIAASQEKKAFETKLRAMVKGYPIEAMVPDILKQDRMVAAFLVSIGKKESNWGKRVPVLDGQDCFNYWGYRGIRDRMGTGGHTCFDSRQDAVNTVAKRIKTLVETNQLDTPQKMILWKCGFTCSGQNHADVLKWISDVDLYFSQLNQKDGGV